MVRVVEPTPTLAPIILLIEDDADTRDMYHMSLELDGFRVVESATGVDALVRAVEVKPDLVVTDIGLRGGIDGVRVAEELKSDIRTAAVPVLALTGTDPRTLGPAPGLFEQVLLKPVLPEELSARVRSVLEQSRALRDRSHQVRRRLPALFKRAHRAQTRAKTVFERRAQLILQQPCPACGIMLTWRERRTVRGGAVDRFEPCGNGCGAYEYELRSRRTVRVNDD
jgi:DNA-binding response OmpR family regulator